jgi:hypothetical protein
MIDDEFEVCFELLLSVVLAKRRMQRVSVRVTCQSHIPGAQKKKLGIYCAYTGTAYTAGRKYRYGIHGGQRKRANFSARLKSTTDNNNN